jgi:hypothetical protein
MNRRTFLHRASTGTIALGSLPLLASKAWADGGEGRGFNFVAVGFGSGTDRLLISGNGTFEEDEVEGGGKFDHFIAGGTPPVPLVSTGTWKAKEFVNFKLPTMTAPGNPNATHGVYQAGILTLIADFYPIGQPKVKGVQIEIVCNLTPAGASTPGKDEGVYLTFDGVAFQPGGLGITVFTLN